MTPSTKMPLRRLVPHHAAGLVWILVIATLLTSGCSKDGAGQIVLRFLDQPDNSAAWREIIGVFEASNPGVKVELVEGPTATDTRETMYSTALMSGDSVYDIVYMDVVWVPKFASRGWLLPLDEWFMPEQREAFLPGDIRGSIYDGHIYRVPMRSDAGVLFYRSDLTPDPPATFRELADAARMHQEIPDRWGFIFQGAQYEGLVCSFLEILWGHGGDVLDSDGRVVLDSAEGLAALSWMVDAVGEITPEAVVTYQEEETRRLFQEGRSVFLRNWPYVWRMIESDDSLLRGKVAVSGMPGGEGMQGASVLGGWGFGIAADCPHPERAWEFIRHACSEESMRILHGHNGALPARRSLYSDPRMLEANPRFPDLYKVLLTARPRPVHPKYPQISDAIQVHVSAALVGREDPRAALRSAAVTIREIVGR